MKKNTMKGFMLLALALGTGYAAFAQTPEQRAAIVRTYDQEATAELKTQLQKQSEENLKRAYELAAINGWPLEIENGKWGKAYLSGVSKDDKPLYEGNRNDGPTGSAHTARVTALRPGGSLGLNLRGQNMTIGMWEISYPRKSHVELTGRISDGSTTDNGFFQSHNDETGHATHVAGTMIGSGTNSPDARGIAYAAKILAYNSQNDESEALDAATDPTKALLVSNHSYGLVWEVVNSLPWLPGAYSEEARNWDQLTFAAPYYQPVFAAGNDMDPGDPLPHRDYLLGSANAKNPIIVAATWSLPQSGYNNNPATVAITDFSSFGPTDDRRIKPDIAAKGMEVWSCWSSNNTAHFETQGTSMAAPAVAGVLTLLQQHYSNLNAGQFMRAATVKGLVLNTADEAGNFDGPDYRFGWGLINAEKAAQMITVRNNQSIIEELTLTQGQTYTKQITAIGTKPLKATICWTDPAGNVNETANSTTPALRNNLNMRIKKTNEADQFPWKLNPSDIGGAAIKGINNVDNVETVEIKNANGIYTIEITNGGGQLVGGSQKFSLIVDGVTGVTGGISSNELNEKISVYPNPVTGGIVNIALDASLDASGIEMSLYDIQGRTVRQFNKFADKIDVSNLASGVYMLNISNDGMTASKKIIID